MVLVGLHSVGTHNKKFGCQKIKKIKYTLPSVVQLALGKDGVAECLSLSTRQSLYNTSLPSAMTMALGKEENLGTGKAIFAEC
jgi:hypothetical protein